MRIIIKNSMDNNMGATIAIIAQAYDSAKPTKLKSL